MTAPVHATEADVRTYTGDNALVAPARVLVKASNLVTNATRLWVYATDDTDAANAMRDAVCEQVAYWAETKDDGTQADEWQAASIDGVSYTRNPTRGEGTNGNRLCAAAALILSTAGIPTGVSVRG